MIMMLKYYRNYPKGKVIMGRNTPLYNRLIDHNKLNRSSFHTPGHKCNGFFDKSIISLDYTELPDTDALYEANDVILETEKRASELFGAYRSLISAGGCSLAIQTMLKIASERGGKLLCARNAHRSAINAVALLGMEPVWISPDGGDGFTGRISPKAVEDILNADRDITACYITSPSYYGEISDISAISEICHKHDVILLVDNAHGSHLAFMKDNMHPISNGADMSACSLHKTLPVLTGGALLNIANPALAENAKEAMSLFGSTSPSYIIMSSIDLCVDYMFGEGKKAYAECEKKVKVLKCLAESRGIKQPKGLCDPLRITLNTASVGLFGEEQGRYFEEHGIDCEFCDGENAVFICTPFNSDQDFERLERAIKEIPIRDCIELKKFSAENPIKKLSVREAMLSASETVSTEESVGRVSANTVCPCPPGIPLIMPGEIINAEIAEMFIKSGIKQIKAVK